ncbi:hypothetical protein E4N00_24235, partial [Salmonella enterica]|nr:hypothetical protein [Salmonella enterica]
MTSINLAYHELYPSYFKLLVRWLRLLTPVTYLSMLRGFARLPPSGSSNYLGYKIHDTIFIKKRISTMYQTQIRIWFNFISKDKHHMLGTMSNSYDFFLSMSEISFAL